MDRLACVIAAGVWDGKRALLKNRDRKYIPRVTLIRELLDGVEVAYMRDNVTGWCEGLNEHGIGIANAALAVGLDEAEGTTKAVEDKKGKKGKSLDGARILKALACRTVQDAIDSLCSHLGGLEGHSFVSDPNRAFSVELINGDCVIKPLEGSEIHVRTNHGRDTGGTGYTDGEGYLSSAARKEKSTQILRQSKTPTDLGPDLMRNRSEGPRTHNDPVRDTDSMATTSQMVMNLTDRELDFYVIPGKMDYEGLEDNLPKGYEPKITVKVFSYRNGGKELVEVNPKTGLVRKSVEPVKLASRVASRFITADVPEKYKHIDFKPPQSVADAAEKGLDYREKASPSNKGGLTPAQAAKQGIGSGVQRAVNLKNRDNISPDTIKQMTAFFSRHEKNKGVAPEHKGEPWNDKGNVAWLIWGGDPGRAWAEKVKKQMEAADEKSEKKASIQSDDFSSLLLNFLVMQKARARGVAAFAAGFRRVLQDLTRIAKAFAVPTANLQRAMSHAEEVGKSNLPIRPGKFSASQHALSMAEDAFQGDDIGAALRNLSNIVSVLRMEAIDSGFTGPFTPLSESVLKTSEDFFQAGKAARVAARYLQGAEHELRELTPATEHQSPVEIIEAELTVLESLWSDVQAVLDTYSSVVPMPHVGRIAGADLALHSQTEVFAKCEHAMRHAERVVNMCRTQLQLQPGDADVSSFLRDAQMLYDRFSEARATARELLSAMNQKIVPAALKGIVAEAVDAVKAVTRYPNSVTVKVHAHMVPVELNNGMVSAQVFDAYVTVYPLPRDEQPEYQQFVFTQCTLGDTSVYLTVIDRANEKSPAKPVKVTDGATAAKKILAALKGWSGLF